MIRIGLLSDTHGFIDPGIFQFFNDCDEIWHAGDIGTWEVIESLSRYKPFFAVYGNIDPQTIKRQYPEYLILKRESVSIAMIHIGGYPGRYSPEGKRLIIRYKPQLFISGHSHILKVMYDETHSLLHINPGAAGRFGLHTISTIIRFVIDKDRIRDLEIYEMKKIT